MRRLAPVCLALCVFVTPAAAEPITLQFTGTLNSVDPDVAHALDIGDSFEFALTYETGPPRSTGSLFNIYDGTIAGRIGGYSFDSMSAGTGILASKRSGGLSFEYRRLRRALRQRTAGRVARARADFRLLQSAHDTR